MPLLFKFSKIPKSDEGSDKNNNRSGERRVHRERKTKEQGPKKKQKEHTGASDSHTRGEKRRECNLDKCKNLSFQSKGKLMGHYMEIHPDSQEAKKATEYMQRKLGEDKVARR